MFDVLFSHSNNVVILYLAEYKVLPLFFFFFLNVACFHLSADFLGTKSLSVSVWLTQSARDEVSFTKIGQALSVSTSQPV